MSVIAKKIEELREIQQEKEFEIEKLAKSVMPEFSFEHTIGTWDCKNSPMGLCVYNHFEDQCLDNCLFCGEPDERK